MTSYRLPKRFKAYCSSAPSPASSGAPRQGHLGLGGGEAHGEKRLGGPLHRQHYAQAQTSPWLNSDAMPALQGALQLQDDALGGLLPHPGDMGHPRDVLGGDGIGELGRRERRKCRQGHLRPYLRHTDELLEQRPLLLGEKAEQRDAVLRHGQVGEHAGCPRPRPACPGRPPAWPRRSPRRRHRCRPSAAAAPPPRFRSETQSCEPSILVGRVADGRRQRVGRVVRLGNADQERADGAPCTAPGPSRPSPPPPRRALSGAGYTRPRQGRPRHRPQAPPRGPGPWRRRP